MSEVINKIRASGNWSPEASDDQVWSDTLRFYQTVERQERKKVIDKIKEDHLPNGIIPNHETADAWDKLRQLERIDYALWQAGR
jgi:hypothetical protein